MGTHSYRMEIMPEAKFKFDISEYDGNVVNEPEFYGKDDNDMFSNDYSCREILLANLKELYEESDEKLSIGIRCFGEMYHKVSSIFYGDSVKQERLKAFMKNITDLVFDVKFNRVLTDSGSKFIGTRRVVLRDKTIKFNHTITLEISSTNNRSKANPYIISALLAILREVEILRKVADGSIESMNDFLTEIMRISAERRLRAGKSYPCFSMVIGSNSRTIEEVFPLLQTELSEAINSDGCDWLSLFLLGAFIRKYGKNFHEGNEGDSVSGPVEYFLVFSDKDTIREIIKLSKNLKARYLILFSIIGVLSDISDTRENFWKHVDELGGEDL